MGQRAVLTPLADAENRHRKGKVVQSHSEKQSGTWDRNLAFSAQVQGCLSASDVIRGETGAIVAQRGASSGQDRDVCSPVRWPQVVA